MIDHEPRTRDISVLTLRPSERMDFVPGQYVTVQTARWPRVWRRFSIANAPRLDGTLRLHVRAVPGGWVSTALVRHTRIGDQLLLGPPVGTMTPPESDRDLLCVAGGTGLAPLKAVIEHVIASGDRPNIHLLFGVRRASDLYDMPDLVRMETAFPWLRVVPVVSDDPGYDGMRGGSPTWSAGSTPGPTTRRTSADRPRWSTRRYGACRCRGCRSRASTATRCRATRQRATQRRATR
ncbi:hypothetical protein GCM10027612_47080 [Microbispora bryophytorum subsp. camponoti]